MNIQLVRTPAGNFGRIRGALEAVGGHVRLVETAKVDPRAGPVVVAGVSSFSTLSRALGPARQAIHDALRIGTPVLGICAGMQVMYESSEEGPGRGLALFPGKVQLLRSPRVPNLGWSRLEFRNGSALTEGVQPGSYAYFAHSYRVPRGRRAVVARTSYRGERFPSALEQGPAWGVQFHPELSGKVGRQVLRNFVSYCEGAPG